MKYLLLILYSIFTQSCTYTPSEVDEEPIRLNQFWSFEHGTASNSTPVKYKNHIIMAAGLYLYGLDVANGEIVWQTQIDDDNYLQGRQFLIWDDQIVANHVNDIRGWNLKSGNQEWSRAYHDKFRPRRTGYHSRSNNGYLIAGLKSWIFLLNNIGEITFQKRLDSTYSVQGTGTFADSFFIAQRRTVNGALTLGRITALSSSNGDSLWVYETDHGGFINVGPNIENNKLYAGTSGNSASNLVVALNADNGEVIWEYITNEPKEWTKSFLLGPNHVYFAGGAALVALEKTTGRKLWRFDWTSSTLVKPVYLEGFLYHSDHNQLFVLDAESGELVHSEPSPDSYIWHIAVSSDKLFIQTSNKLIAYEPWHLRED